MLMPSTDLICPFCCDDECTPFEAQHLASLHEHIHAHFPSGLLDYIIKFDGDQNPAHVAAQQQRNPTTSQAPQQHVDLGAEEEEKNHQKVHEAVPASGPETRSA